MPLYKPRSMKHARIERLKNRLRDLREDYTPFFAGIPAGMQPGMTLLSELGHLQRTKRIALWEVEQG